MILDIVFLPEHGIYAHAIAEPMYTIYFDFVDVAHDVYGLSKIPLRKRPTANIVPCIDEEDMRKKYKYILSTHEKELTRMQIKVYKER